MGYEYNKGITQLRSEVTAEGEYGLTFTLRVAILLSIAYLGISFLTPNPKDSNGTYLEWPIAIEADVTNRVRWLENFPVVGEFSGRAYYSFAETVTSLLITRENFETHDSEFGFIKPQTWSMLLARYLTSVILLVLFVILTTCPMWILGLCVGLAHPHFHRKALVKGTGLLSVCDRKESPFYSGIHGQWKPNSKHSGMDFSAPGVAIPPMVDRNVANTHSLYKILEQVAPGPDVLDLLRDLLRIVLACNSHPTFVPPECPSDDDVVKVGASQEAAVTTETDKDILTVESNASRTVQAFVEAYQFLEIAFRKSQNIPNEAKESGYKNLTFDDYRKIVTERKKHISDLEFAMLTSLTPTRAQAILQVPLHVCISALLALEAGKSLVFQKSDNNFVQISRFPHLQARAVIQSLASYHKAYEGDFRQILRLSVLGSRRHGDYGRPMLPISCSESVRALRQWLELSQTHSERVLNNSLLIEFEAYIEELYDVFVSNLKPFLSEDPNIDSSERYRGPAVIGFPNKNVVLFPLNKLIELAFKDMPASKLNHLDWLTTEVVSKGLMPRVTVRLPGLSQQLDCLKSNIWPEDSSSSFLAKQLGGAELLSCWRILRHALTRYSWVSTRVGDDLVPSDGIVQALIYSSSSDHGDKLGNKPIGGLASLVPLRTRRFSAMFGETWQTSIYSNSPSEDSVRVFTRYGAFADGIKIEGDANVYQKASSEQSKFDVAQ